MYLSRSGERIDLTQEVTAYALFQGCAADANRSYVKQLEERATHLLTLRSTKWQTRASIASPSATWQADSSQTRAQQPERRFLGASSGLTFIRAAVDLARDEGILKLAPTDEAQMSSKDIHLSQLSCLDDDALLPKWPSAADADVLFDVFEQSQVVFMILSRQECKDYEATFGNTDSPRDVQVGAVLRAVFAIALFTIGQTERSAAALKGAEVYHEQTLKSLPKILPSHDLTTLQIVLLVLQFSLANPQKPIVWHLLGNALRLATSLGLHRLKESADQLGPAVDINLRKRLFWSLYSIDRAVGNSLGR